MSAKAARAARAVVALAVALAGCGLAGGAPGRRTALYVGRTPAQAYRELGLVQAFGTGVRASEADVLRSLRDEGKKMGCDAVVDVDVRAGGSKAHAIGVCVRWAGREAPAGP